MQDATTMMQHQIELEALFNKNQLLPRVRSEFTSCQEVNFVQLFTDNEIPVEFGYDLLVQMVLHKRAPLTTIAGILRWRTDTVQQTLDHIKRMCELDLCHWDPQTERLVVAIDISADVQAELDRFQYPLPMVVEPKQVKKNRDTGYLTGQGSIILKNNHHDGDVCLDHINRMNAVRLTINNNTASLIANSWRNLDKPKDGELKADFEKRVRAFEKFDRTCHDVIALLTQEGNEFYLTHKYDKRGRSYCQGYHVNYQGAPWNKAVIELADKEIIEL